MNLKTNPDAHLQTKAAEIDNRLAGGPIRPVGWRALDHDQPRRIGQHRNGFVIEYTLLGKRGLEILLEYTRAAPATEPGISSPSVKIEEKTTS